MRLEGRMAPVLDRVIASALEKVHTAIPAKVESYNAGTRTCTAKPLVRLRLGAGPLIDIPPIADIPVMFPASAAFHMVYPLASGDLVLLLFSEASLGNWMNASPGSVADPEDSSRFTLTDGIAIPGLYPPNGLPTPDSFLEISEAGKITLTSSSGASAVLSDTGLIGLSNSSGNVKGLMDDLWAELQGAVTDLNTFASTLSGTGTAPVLGSAFAPLVASTAARLLTIAAKAQKVSLVLE